MTRSAEQTGVAAPAKAPLTPTLVAMTALGGGCGALLRALLTHVFPDGSGFPTTVAINVVGAALLALLPAFAGIRHRRWLALALGPGLLGGFTTMSAHAVQTVQVTRPDGGASGASVVAGLGLVLLTLAGSLLAVAAVSRFTRPADRVEFASEDGDE